MGSLRQFRLLLWKNWLLQKRKVGMTLAEILVPTVFTFILFVVRQTTVEVVPMNDPTTWRSFAVGDELPQRLIPPGFLEEGKWNIPYSPKIPVTDRIMARVAERLGVDVTGYESEEAVLEYFRNESVSTYSVLGAICFEENFESDETMNEDILYKIRMPAEQYGLSGGGVRFFRASSWWTSAMYPGTTTIGPRRNESTTGGPPGYYREGFLHIQRAVDLAITKELNNAAETEDIEIRMQRFPFPPYIWDPFVIVIQAQLPSVILLSFVALAPNIVKDVCLEKERKLKETMKMMGLKNFLHWAAWFTKYSVFALIISSIITMFLHVDPSGSGAVINFSSASVTFVFIFLFAVATIMFCFMISTFFSSSNTGAAAGAIIYLFTYLPYNFFYWRYSEMTTAEKAGASLLSNVAMAFGCYQIGMYEGAGIGVHWHNINTPVNNDDDFSMMHVMIMLLICSLIYGTITWYVDGVKPGDFGIPKPFYFPFTKWYWCGRDVEPIDQSQIDEFYEGDKNEFFEARPQDTKAGIQIRDLRKEFKKGGVHNTAVNNLNLDMLEGEITALLGHNGAGKTTTMFMLTGFLPPTSGTAFINGFDIRTDIDKVRQSLGLCPQHNVLFDNMTVEEHLLFFAQLKGLDGPELKRQVHEMIKTTHLEDKTNAKSKSLSGGMKRKLSVAIALIADSKIVILDEPTSGMDPEARRQTWDILQNERHGRTMILTTHFMDEADLLGDRIAIMANGAVQCCGSSLFLKSKYGVGYHMVMVKDATCDVDKVTGMIQTYVPEAQLESNISAELSYLLPRESSHKFEELFTFLENNKEKLGISSFGASVTTLEEVFLKVGETVDEDLSDRLQKGTDTEQLRTNGVVNGGFVPQEDSKTNGTISSPQENRWVTPEPVVTSNDLNKGQTNSVDRGTGENGQVNDGASTSNTDIDMSAETLKPTFGVSFVRNTGFRYLIQQFRSMVEKRMIHTRRNFIMTSVQLFIPLIFTILTCAILNTLPGPRDPPPMTLDLSFFTKPQVAFILEDTTSGNFAEGLRDGFMATVAGVETATQRDLNTEMTDPNMENFLVATAEEDMQQYVQNYMIAGSFIANDTSELNRSTVSIAHFNNEAYHTPAISLAFMQNAIIKLFAGDQYDVTTVNHPLPRRATTAATDELDTGMVISYIISWYVAFGMAFMISTFVIFLIKERMSKAKHVQYVSGVHVGNFWAATFVWDFLCYLVPSVLQILIFYLFGVEAYYTGSNAGYTFMIFMFFGWSVLPFVYLLSFAFSVPAAGYVWITVINIFTGTVSIVVVTILEFPDFGTELAAEVMTWVFYATLPNFCFGNALHSLFMNHQGQTVCKAVISNVPGNLTREQVCMISNFVNVTNPCCPEFPEICGISCVQTNDNFIGWEAPGIGRALVFLALQGVIFFFILFIMESGSYRRIWSKAVSGSYATSKVDDSAVEISLASMSHVVEEDIDVKAERERINETPLHRLMGEDTLILKELKKYYGNFLAVDRLSIGVPQGECFGLLGVNGAGKTTTFKMMTGDEMISSGEAYLSGFSVKDEIKEVQQKLGYCPQFDALIDQMTVTETLKMYGRLRGINENDLNDVVVSLIDSLLLTSHAHKQAGRLSGGNKRKLSTAMALIGDPPIIFLDEPTTGMDPVARRLLWDTLTKVRASGRTLVLTSHSMEECEALCTRMAIMVNGQFKCLGGTQHLKNKFGEGYTLIAKIRSTGSENAQETSLETQTAHLKNFVEKQFPGCELKDAHIGLVHYQIKSEGVTWAGLFGTMERAKVEYNIEDYSVSQTTLEQVFINFARAQVDPRDTSMSCKVKCTNCCQFFCCKCCCS